MAIDAKHPPSRSPARFWQALIPVIALIIMIYACVVVFQASAHLALILAAAAAAVVGLCRGMKWDDLEEGMIEGIMVGMKAMLILMVIGMLIATWILSGIVPIMIYYGLQLLAPSFFLAASCIICCVVSISTGSSWTTAGTVGVALIGVGQGLAMPLPAVAGAIVSGAYFGDKMSPLSDTTNLAPAVAGSELFEHIRYMVHTTGPALILALIGYALLGWGLGETSATPASLAAICDRLQEHFNLHPLLLTPPLLVILMVLLRLPALPALLGGALLGGLLALAFQGSSLADVIHTAFSGYTADTGMDAVDSLLSRGGLVSMLETVALIICALAFGGIMEKAGLLAVLAQGVLRFARGTGSLVSATVVTCFGMNVLAPDQYLSVVVPGRMYREAYAKQGLEPKLLSRTLEDAGTLSSPLIGWNTCGAFMSKTLGVSSMAFAPYAFLNWLTPLVAIVIACAGWSIVKQNKPRPPARSA